MNRRFTAPRRGVSSPPGQELLGVITSHGPSRESYTPLRKERGPRAETARPSAAGPAVLAQGMRAAAFTPNTRDSTIAAASVGKRRGSGRSGKPGGSTGPRRLANESGTGKASATGSASKSANRLRKRRFQKPRGSSLRNFFDGCCDRPGCYECFVRSRRSPRQRFCSHACRRAMECVWERERRWRRRRGRVPHLGRARPRARQP